MTTDDLVTIATFGNIMEASVARGALQAAGISAFVPGESVGVFTRNPPVRLGQWAELKVKARDRDRAVEALKKAGHR